VSVLMLLTVLPLLPCVTLDGAALLLRCAVAALRW
jgi:hypothetical protein